MKYLRLVLLIAVATAACGLAGPAAAKPWWMRGVDANESDFLPPDQAFRVSSRIDGDVLHVRWVIADGYYLYREKIQIQAESPDLVVASANFPRGTTKTDPYLGTQQIFTQQIEATAAFTRSDYGAHPIQIKVTYQGCAEAGLCYPPISKVMFPTVGGPDPGATMAALHDAALPDAALPDTAAHDTALPPRGATYAIVGGGLAFFLAGLLLRKGRHLASPT
jgi:thiol:disulfide interchange protein DsbD